MAKELTLSDVFASAGIENEEYIEYADKDEIADNEVSFDISNIEQVESYLNRSGKQWLFTIHYTDFKNNQVTEYLNLDPDMQRDKKVKAIQASLESHKNSIVKNCLLIKQALRKEGRTRFDIVVK